MKFKLLFHNSVVQMNWGNNDDTIEHLKLGQIYEGKKEIHRWHTKIIIDGRKYNSVCFKELGK